MFTSDIGEIERILKDVFGSGKTLIACVGSPLRSDDRAGLILYEKIRGLSSDRIRVVECPYGLENCYSEITGFQPDTLIIVDSVLIEKVQPGTIVLSSPENIAEKMGIVTTHNIPVKLTLQTLSREASIKTILVLGVRIADAGMGMEVSRPVVAAVEKISRIISGAAEARHG